MKYTVTKEVFDKNNDICFGIIVGKGLKNLESESVDHDSLRAAEEGVKALIQPSEVKTFPRINAYREAMRNVGINPNKYKNSVEALCSRVVKSGAIPCINAIVDLTNIIALTEFVTLGAHDLADIKEDMEVRYSTTEDQFLPIGQSEPEQMPDGELVFISGKDVQTRQWLWRQSDMGKITMDSSNMVFQLVGFKGEHYEHFQSAMNRVKDSIENRFGGEATLFEVNENKPSIEF